MLKPWPVLLLPLPFQELGISMGEFLAICPKKGYLILQGEGCGNGERSSDFLKLWQPARPEWSILAVEVKGSPKRIWESCVELIDGAALQRLMERPTPILLCLGFPNRT